MSTNHMASIATIRRERTSAVREDESWIIIIRCIHCRGERQALALRELERRGLWLTDEQRFQAGFSR